MEKEISVFFNNDHKCKECGKSYHQEHMKRKHLTFNHSYLVEQIMDQVYQSLDIESGKHPTQPGNELPEDEENESLDDTQKMLIDQNFRDNTKIFIDEDDDDFQNQLMLIQNLSDSEDEDDDTITDTDDWGALLISPQKKQEITEETLLIDDNFSYDKEEDSDEDERYDISSDEEDN